MLYAAHQEGKKTSGVDIEVSLTGFSFRVFLPCSLSPHVYFISYLSNLIFTCYLCWPEWSSSNGAVTAAITTYNSFFYTLSLNFNKNPFPVLVGKFC